MDIISSIIPFNLLIDTDMGILKYIQISYPPNWHDLYYTEIMEMIGPEHNLFLQDLLIHRSFANPLSTIIRAEKMITCKPDVFYRQLMEKEKDMILKLSMSTGIMEMVCKSLFLHDALRFDILCEDEKESDMLKSRFESHFKTSRTPASIIIDAPENINLARYGNIYLKDVRDIKRYKHPIEGKNIIIARYDFNKDVDPVTGEIAEVPLFDTISEYTGKNGIRFIDVYSIDENQVGVG